MGGKEGNYLEASGTAMFIYAFAKGAKKGYLDQKYLDIANKAFDSMVEVMVITGEDGLPVLTKRELCTVTRLSGITPLIFRRGLLITGLPVLPAGCC